MTHNTNPKMKETTVAFLRQAVATFNKTYGTSLKSDLIDRLNEIYMAATDSTEREVAGYILQGLKMAKRKQFNPAARNAIRALGGMGLGRTQLIDDFCQKAGITRL